MKNNPNLNNRANQTAQSASDELLEKLQTLINEHDYLIHRQYEPLLMITQTLLFSYIVSLYQKNQILSLTVQKLEKMKDQKNFQSYKAVRDTFKIVNPSCVGFLSYTKNDVDNIKTHELVDCFNYITTNMDELVVPDPGNMLFLASKLGELVEDVRPRYTHKKTKRLVTELFAQLNSVKVGETMRTVPIAKKLYEALESLFNDFKLYESSDYQALKTISPTLAKQFLSSKENISYLTSALAVGMQFLPHQWLVPQSMLKPMARMMGAHAPVLQHQDLKNRELTEDEAQSYIAKLQDANIAIKKTAKWIEYAASVAVVSYAVYANYQKSLLDAAFGVAPSAIYAGKIFYGNLFRPMIYQCKAEKKVRDLCERLSLITDDYRETECEIDHQQDLATTNIIMRFKRVDVLSAEVVTEIVKNILLKSGIKNYVRLGKTMLAIAATEVIDVVFSHRIKHELDKEIAQEQNIKRLRLQIRELTEVLNTFALEMPSTKNDTGRYCEWIFDFSNSVAGWLDYVKDNLPHYFPDCEIKIDHHYLSISGAIPNESQQLAKFKTELKQQKEKLILKAKCLASCEHHSSTAGITDVLAETKSTRLHHRKTESNKASVSSSRSGNLKVQTKESMVIDFDGEIYDSSLDEKVSQIVPMRGACLPQGKFFIEYLVDKNRCPRGYEKAKTVTREGRVTSMGQGIYFVSKPKTIKDEHGLDVDAKVKIKLGADSDGLGDLRFYGGMKTKGDKVLYRVTHWEKGHKNYNNRKT